MPQPILVLARPIYCPIKILKHNTYPFCPAVKARHVILSDHSSREALNCSSVKSYGSLLRMSFRFLNGLFFMMRDLQDCCGYQHALSTLFYARLCSSPSFWGADIAYRHRSRSREGRKKKHMTTKIQPHVFMPANSMTRQKLSRINDANQTGSTTPQNKLPCMTSCKFTLHTLSPPT